MKKSIIFRWGVIEIVQQVKFRGVNIWLILKEEDFGVPLVANICCLFHSFLMICPTAAIDKYRQAMLVDSRQSAVGSC